MTKEEFEEEIIDLNNQIQKTKEELTMLMGEQRYIIKRAKKEGLINEKGEYVENDDA